MSLCVAKCTGLNVVVKTYLRHKLGSKGQLQVRSEVLNLAPRRIPKTDVMLAQVQTEIQIHSSLSNPNIVKLLLAFEDSRWGQQLIKPLLPLPHEG